MKPVRNVVLGVCGSIAAHKAIDVASQLTRAGHSVHAVLTAEALRHELIADDDLLRDALQAAHELRDLDLEAGGVEVARRDVDEPRRAGDPAVLVASSERARELLGWQPQRPDLTTIVADAWEHLQQHG
jgi:nucleoside-diphosphate-sugar epimerase